MSLRKLLAVTILLSVLLGAGIYSFPGYVKYIRDNQENLGYDFFYIYSTIRALNDGCPNIYESAEIHEFVNKLSNGKWSIIGDRHAPPYFVLCMPFAFFSFTTGYHLIVISSFIMYVIAVTVLVFYLIEDRRASALTAIMIAVYTLFCSTGVDNIFLGQVGFILTFLLIMTFYFGERERWWLCGFFLALAIIIKMHPLLLLFYYGIRRNYRVLVSCPAFLLLFSLLSGVLWGFQRYAQYVVYLSHDLAGRKSYVYAYAYTMEQSADWHPESLIGWLASAFRYNISLTELKILYVVLFVLLLYVMLRISQEAGVKSGRRINALEFSMYMMASLVFTPFSFSHSHIIVMIPFITFIALYLRGELSGKAAAPLLGILSFMGVFWILDGNLRTRDWILDLHYRYKYLGFSLYSLLLIYLFTIMLFFIHSKKRNDVGAPAVKKHHESKQ